jgi:diacylglycerol diphosphate phosphatase/phosphatidate phosphatase
VNPFHRMFSLDNKAIQYPMAAHERVPVSKYLDIPTIPAQTAYSLPF